MTPFDVVKKLADDRGETLADVERTLKLPTNSLYSLKKHKPSIARAEALANYFGVSLDEIYGLIPLKENQNGTFRAIQRGASALSSDDQKRLLNIMKATFGSVEKGEIHDDTTNL